MSAKPQKTKIRKGGLSGISKVDYLYYSFGDFFEAEHYADGKTEDQLKAFWEKHSKAIMTRYLEENRLRGPGWAGVRPWSWWKYGMRGSQMPVPPGEDSKRVWDHQRDIYDWVEDDYTYLKRLNLLEPWEIEAKRLDFY